GDDPDRTARLRTPRRHGEHFGRCDAARGLAPHRHDRVRQTGDLRGRPLGGGGARGRGLDRGQPAAVAPGRGAAPGGAGALSSPVAAGPRSAGPAAPRRMAAAGAQDVGCAAPAPRIPSARVVVDPRPRQAWHRTLV
ncbi:MAG: hypothetical protein AVDCRST_MAG19-4316, partial [uncultured Thermomicrobiales bacterium]